MTICKIVDDKREISAVYQLNDESAYIVGKGNITAIKPYDENGEYAPFTWLAIFKGEQIAIRIPANAVEIHYALGVTS